MIEVKNLIKRYGNHTAVSNLSFNVASGQIIGFLGPNGAGKTTTMNIMTGCLAATEGQITVDGYDIYEDGETAKKLIGYLPELPPLYQDMTPGEYLRFVAKAKGVAKKDIEKQMARVEGITGIAEVKDRLIKNLSKGYRQRVGIAQALLGNPKIIILDEPTVGLDPKQIIEIRELIKSLGKEHTVILSSHILSEVREVCDRIIIINKGKLVANDSPENLEKRFTGNFTIRLKVRAVESEVRQALQKLPEVTDITYEPGNDGRADVVVTTSGDKDISEDVFFAFCDIRKPISSLELIKTSLEDIFIELTDEKTEKVKKREEHRVKGIIGKLKEYNDEVVDDGDDGDDYDDDNDNENVDDDAKEENGQEEDGK